MSESKREKIGIIGCGNMGSSFGKYLSAHHHVYLFDRNKEKAKALSAETGASMMESNAELLEHADIVILAIKPQDFHVLAAEIKNKLNPHHLLVTILAGITIRTLKQTFGDLPIIRAVPNLAIQYGEGVIGLAEQDPLPIEKRRTIETLFSPFGLLLWLPEDKMDALTALTGSGPAFASVMIEAMVDAGLAIGFPASRALPLVLQMLKGTITLIEQTQKHPGELRWQVTSPSGTTIAGLKALEKEGVRSGIMQTFIATYERAKQLSNPQ
jgi:pyrroline-5-carboxylate reductase